MRQYCCGIICVVISRVRRERCVRSVESGSCICSACVRSNLASTSFCKNVICPPLERGGIRQNNFNVPARRTLASHTCAHALLSRRLQLSVRPRYALPIAPSWQSPSGPCQVGVRVGVWAQVCFSSVLRVGTLQVVRHRASVVLWNYVRCHCVRAARKLCSRCRV